MFTPPPRGPLSDWVRRHLTGTDSTPAPEVRTAHDPAEVLRDDDLQLALWCCYQLHHTGFDDVPSDAEWDPDVLSFRPRLEAPFEEALHTIAAPQVATLPDASLAEQVRLLLDTVRRSPGAGLARHLAHGATLAQAQDFMRRHSIHHLKESDAVSFLLPRLCGRAKVALAEVQFDEYGAGVPGRPQQDLFAAALEACELSPRPGAYLADADALTLAADNVRSLLCLHRRLRGMAVGHLVAFEASNSLRCARIADGMRRLGLDEAARYFDEHVEADAVHEQVALRDIAVPLVDDEPLLHLQVLSGVALCLAVDALVSGEVVADWGRKDPRLRDDDAGVA